MCYRIYTPPEYHCGVYIYIYTRQAQEHTQTHKHSDSMENDKENSRSMRNKVQQIKGNTEGDFHDSADKILKSSPNAIADVFKVSPRKKTSKSRSDGEKGAKGAPTIAPSALRNSHSSITGRKIETEQLQEKYSILLSRIEEQDEALSKCNKKLEDLRTSHFLELETHKKTRDQLYALRSQNDALRSDVLHNPECMMHCYGNFPIILKASEQAQPDAGHKTTSMIDGRRNSTKFSSYLKENIINAMSLLLRATYYCVVACELLAWAIMIALALHAGLLPNTI